MAPKKRNGMQGAHGPAAGAAAAAAAGTVTSPARTPATKTPVTVNQDFSLFPADICFLCDAAMVPDKADGRHGHRTVVDPRAEPGSRAHTYAAAVLQRASVTPTRQSRLLTVGSAVYAVVCKPCYTKGDKATDKARSPSGSSSAGAAVDEPAEEAPASGQVEPAPLGLDEVDEFFNLGRFKDRSDDDGDADGDKENVDHSAPGTATHGTVPAGSLSKATSGLKHGDRDLFTVCVVIKQASGDESPLRKMDVDLAGSFVDLEKQVKSVFGLQVEAVTLAYREPKRGGSKTAVVGLADDVDFQFFVKAIRAAPKNASFVVVAQVKESVAEPAAASTPMTTPKARSLVAPTKPTAASVAASAHGALPGHLMQSLLDLYGGKCRVHHEHKACYRYERPEDEHVPLTGQHIAAWVKAMRDGTPGVDLETPPNVALFSMRPRKVPAGKKRSSSPSSSPEADRRKRHAPPASMAELFMTHALAPIMMRLAEAYLPGVPTTATAGSPAASGAASSISAPRPLPQLATTQAKVTYEALEEEMLALGATAESASNIVSALKNENIPPGLAGELTDTDLVEMKIDSRGDRMVLRKACARLARV